MAAAKPQKTLADLVTIAFSPALIMALVGSLVFFLIAVLYQGRYEGRLEWTMFFFVFATVLIARLSMQGDDGRSIAYGLALAVVTLIALEKFIEYAPGAPFSKFSFLVNIFLLAVVWWSAHKLTWDCTLIDDHVDASGSGLLAVTGWEEKEAERGDLQDAAVADEDEEEAPSATAATPPEPAAPKPGLFGWLQRYAAYREKQNRRPHTPGVWVVYFSLAALPLYGLGQSLIPAGDVARRRYVFWLMAIYVASGLGLLLTTSFLNLRRYLRQRKLQMPQAVTGLWLAVGGGLIVALLVLGALLPRPHSEYPITQMVGLAGSKDQKASKMAVKRDSPGKGEGRASTDRTKGEKAEGKSGNQPDKQGDRTTQGKQGQGGSKASEQSKSGNSQDKQGQSGKNSPGKDPSKGGNKPNPSKDDNQSGKQDDSKKNGEDQQQQHQGNFMGEEEPESQTNDPDGSEKGSTMDNFMEHASSVMNVLKWIVYGIVALVGLYLVVRFFANFTGWAKGVLAWWHDLWNRLLGRREPEGAAEEAAAAAAEERAPPPFAAYGDPFQDGTASRRPPAELVRYSFEALEAWAWEKDLGRQPEETPLEFVHRLADQVPVLETDGQRLANLYAQVAYARAGLSTNCLGTLRQFWRQLHAAEAQPLSAGAVAEEKGDRADGANAPTR